MSNHTMKDGVYNAFGSGFLGQVPVEVTVAEGRVSNIAFGSNQETESFFHLPSITIPRAVTAWQSLDVDLVTGATYSSRAILNGITDCVRQAGGDEAVERMKKNKVEKPGLGKTESYDCDICVIGTGGAGTMAAAAAAERGAKVIVLEKAPYIGGITVDVNCMLAVDSDIQLEAGVHNPMPEMYENMMNWNHFKGNGRLVSRYLHQTRETVNWMNDVAGVGMYYRGREQLTDAFECPVHFPVFANQAARRSQIQKCLDVALKHGAEVLLEVRGGKLIQDQKGVIHGVEGERYDGTHVVVNARAVIVATGSFDANPKYNQCFTDGARLCTPAWQMTGDGLEMCLEAGCGTKDMGARVIHCCRPGRGQESRCPEDLSIITSMIVFPAAIFLNHRGERYCNEWLMHNSQGIANANTAQGNFGDFYSFFSEDFVEILERGTSHDLGVHDVPGGCQIPYTEEGAFADFRHQLKVAESIGFVVRGETLDQLAEKLKIAPETLKWEIERYNGFCQAGYDEDFFKSADLLHPFHKGPFYCIRATSETFGSLGGIRNDDRLRVVDDNRRVIPGLYVAGNCASGIWGEDSYGCLEGATCGWAFNSGRMAGKFAVDYLNGVMR